MKPLPPNWTEASIGSICVDTEQVTPEAEVEFTYVDIGSVDRVTKRITSPQRLLGRDAPSRARKLIRTGDTIVSTTRPNLNAVALVDLALNDQIASTGFEVLRAPGLDPRWLGYLVRTSAFVEAMSSLVQGALYPAVRGKDVRSFVAPVAPSSEQKRIADKLDAVFIRVDSVNACLARVALILKRFRQSVLATATLGRLTEDWRSNEAPAWSELRFSDAVLESSTGLVRSATDQVPMRDGLTPYLKMNSIGEIWGYKCNELPGVHCSTEELDRYELQQGDWLFNTRNSVELVGKSCVWNGPAGVVFNNNLLRVRFKAAINPIWVEIYFRSPIGRNLLNAIKSATTSVAAIYQRTLMELPLKLPPEREQTEIVRRVETLLAFADRLEARLQRAQTAAERLPPALLAKAFRGELVPQNPNDEPATELLCRLQADRPASKFTRGNRAAV